MDWIFKCIYSAESGRSIRVYKNMSQTGRKIGKNTKPAAESGQVYKNTYIAFLAKEAALLTGYSAITLSKKYFAIWALFISLYE